MGLLEFFENFRYMEVMSEARREPWFRSHPLSTDRIEALRRRAEASEFREVKDKAEDVQRFEMMRAKIQGFLYPAQQTFQKYPQSDRSLPARYARAIAAFKAPDFGTAIRETQALIAEHPDNPYFQELLGQIYFENGRIDESIAPNRRSVELRPSAPLLKINLARSIIAGEETQAYGEAETLLNAALRMEPDNAFAWRQLATLYDQRGDGGLARLATAEEAYSLGDIVRAHQFAHFATEQLTKDTPQWRRASDIALITEPEAQKLMRRQGDERRRVAFAPALITSQEAAAGQAHGSPAASYVHDHAGHAH
jgi:predicted Zn-dependent protease